MSGIDTTSNLGQNVALSLETLFRRNVIPLGVKNNVNLTYTLPGGEAAAAGTLEVWLSGLKLIPPDDFVLAPDGKSFTIVLDPTDGERLGCPPQQDEPFSVNYLLLDC